MYEDSVVRFDEFVCPLRITKTDTSSSDTCSYHVVFPKRLGELSVTISSSGEEMECNPVGNLLNGLQAGLSRSEFAPNTPYVLSGQKTATGTWLLYRTNLENEANYHYAFDCDQFWIDVRGFCKTNKLFTFETLSKWIREGIIVKGTTAEPLNE